MPVEVISFLLSGEDKGKHLQFQIILQCAPLLKGIKAACIINIDRQHCGEIEGILEGTDIEYKILMVKEEKCLVIFYRRQELSIYLENNEVREYLEHCGYVCQNLEKVLWRLSARVCQYCCRGAGFPHEIGAFLEYPVDDVKAFIEREGRGELLSGYWKVYHNPGKALMTFLAYDKARTSAVNEFLTGRSIKEIASTALY